MAHSGTSADVVTATYNLKASHVQQIVALKGRLPGNYYVPHSVSGGRIGICRRIGNEEWVQCRKGSWSSQLEYQLLAVGAWPVPPDGSQAASNWQRIMRCKDIHLVYKSSGFHIRHEARGQTWLWCYHPPFLFLASLALILWHLFLAVLQAHKITVKIRGKGGTSLCWIPMPWLSFDIPTRDD